jgi:hypothetical protein
MSQDSEQKKLRNEKRLKNKRLEEKRLKKKHLAKTRNQKYRTKKLRTKMQLAKTRKKRTYLKNVMAGILADRRGPLSNDCGFRNGRKGFYYESPLWCNRSTEPYGGRYWGGQCWTCESYRGYNGDEKVSPLIFAIQSGSVDRVKELIRSCAEQLCLLPNTGTTPLMYACKNATCCCAWLLLDAGADPNATDCNGTTALMYACKNVTCCCARLLLDAGADPNATDCNGTTALMYACNTKVSPLAMQISYYHTRMCPRNRRNLVKMLLDAGADPTAENIDGSAPLSFAMTGSDSGIVELLEDTPVVLPTAEGAVSSAPHATHAAAVVTSGGASTASDGSSSSSDTSDSDDDSLDDE